MNEKEYIKYIAQILASLILFPFLVIFNIKIYYFRTRIKMYEVLGFIAVHIGLISKKIFDWVCKKMEDMKNE